MDWLGFLPVIAGGSFAGEPMSSGSMVLTTLPPPRPLSRPSVQPSQATFRPRRMDPFLAKPTLVFAQLMGPDTSGTLTLAFKGNLAAFDGQPGWLQLNWGAAKGGDITFVAGAIETTGNSIHVGVPNPRPALSPLSASWH